ncbi:RNA-guided endonuclease InsQ/TnpB family protein [Spirulina subsalsa]|uniref:RNA-guided endonuclease InsQ/TnpB family protein n=1 Tax=Spirulina subsalsa TaxID=54311 RepID=UPI0002E54675|nr:RNA-guided endonuclease TnpB family protein [Spirulina subsalsa]
MRQVVKVRLYPTSEQKLKLTKAFGSVRWLWNYCLALTNETYKATGKGVSGMELKKQLPLLKQQEETAWLSETYSQCLQQSVLNLSQAFVNFFEGQAKYPRFKSKQGKQSLQYPQNVKVLENGLQFPKLGAIKANLHRLCDGQVKTVTLSRTQTGKYFASILFETNEPELTAKTEGKAVGVDLGLKHFAVTSDGQKIASPKHFRKHERNLRRKQQKLSRKQKGSNSRNKARRLVARAYEKVSNARQDFLHKLSRKIVNENQVIIVEDLSVKGMMSNQNLAKSIADSDWGMFQNFLAYKASRDGKTYLELSRWFPSAKTCNHCLNIVDSLPLDTRSWECPKCHTHHNRDLNAAINIRNEGLRVLASGTGATADGGSVRRNRGRKSSTVQLPTKSETHAVPTVSTG